MWRALIYIAILCLVALGAVWLSDLSGEVTILLPNYVANIDLPVAAALLIALGLVIALFWWLIVGFLRLPFRLGRSSKARRRAKGYQALSRGMIAVGAGDTGQARRHAREAQRLLGEEPLTLLLNAQVAQVTGDLPNADAAFRKMIDNQETRLLGLRGLFIEARRQNNHAAAYRHAQEAAQLAPAAGWANEAVLEEQCMEGAWSDALEMIDKRTAFGLIDKPTAKRQRAVLLTANALAHEHDSPEKALADVLHALKFAPTLIPAAVLAGRMLGQRSEVRKASKILEKAWSANPHPDIADTYIYLRAGDSAQDRLKRAETLGKLSNWQPEARLAIARTALDAREFKRARDAVAPLLSEHPTIRACLLMADIEEAEHGAVGLVREWVARAARAPRDPAWIADGIVSEHWAPFSPVSGHIDAFKWQTPPDALIPSGAQELDLGTVQEADRMDVKEPEPILISATATDIIPVTEEKGPVQPGAEPAAPERSLPTEPLPEPEPSQDFEREEPQAVEEKPIVPDETPPQEGKTGKAPPPAPEAVPEAIADIDADSETIIPPVKPKQKDDAPIAVTPKPVVFPILHAPDDPGIEEDEMAAGKK